MLKCALLLTSRVSAKNCTTGEDCAGDDGVQCVADYCQPVTCTTTGQCVNGQKCSQNPNSRVCIS